MMIDILRSDLVAWINPTHVAADQIVPGEMTIVRDGVDKWTYFHCPVSPDVRHFGLEK